METWTALIVQLASGSAEQHECTVTYYLLKSEVLLKVSGRNTEAFGQSDIAWRVKLIIQQPPPQAAHSACDVSVSGPNQRQLWVFGSYSHSEEVESVWQEDSGEILLTLGKVPSHGNQIMTWPCPGGEWNSPLYYFMKKKNLPKCSLHNYIFTLYTIKMIQMNC